MILANTMPAAHLLNRNFAFDPADHRLREFFLEVFEPVLAPGAPLRAISDLHERAPARGLAPLYKAAYDAMGGSAFRELYRGLLDKAVRPLFPGDILWQRKPGIRIHVPGARTVQYHTDQWYGHGGEVVNIWLPLTDAEGTNSLHLATLRDSLEEVARLEAAKPAMPEINARLRAICKPIAVPYGAFHVFNASCAHGSEENLSGRTRVSLDFRLLLPGVHAGSKSPDAYYEGHAASAPAGDWTPRSPAGSDAILYIYPCHGYTRFLSAHAQRLVCQDFAVSRGLKAVAEETEIHSMAHHPTLLHLAEGKGTHAVGDIVLFSVLCLPEDGADRERVYRTVSAAGTRLHFAAENAAFPAQGAEAIEALRRERAACA